jgi:hypothetical protein
MLLTSHLRAILFFLSCVITTVVSAQGLKVDSSVPVPSFAAQQGQCCVCRAADGSKFKIPQGNGCSIGCAASQGTATGGTEPCYQPGSGSDPAKTYNGPESCLKSFDGGDCKGNNWCKCGVVTVFAVNEDGSELPDFNHPSTSFETTVGHTFRFHATIRGFGGTESGSLRVALQKGAAIIIDGPYKVLEVPNNTRTQVFPISADETPSKSLLPHPPLSYFEQFVTYSFDKPGVYVVSAQVWGAYKWNGDGESCSYECENKIGLPFQQCPEGIANKNLHVNVNPIPH